MKTSIILLCGGMGTRLGQSKAEAKLLGKSFLDWNLELFKELPFEHEVIIVKEGGKTRHESMKMGLKQAEGDIVIVHNVANPMACVQDFTQIHDHLLKNDAACFVGQKIVDTVRQVDDKTSRTIPRENLWRVQTPQGFRKASLKKALSLQTALSLRGTPKQSREGHSDEIIIFEGTDTPIIPFETSDWNIKVTTKKDLEFLEEHGRKEIRVGIGEDAHLFGTKGTLVLGGVKIPGYPKLRANSDGDVILHALCNALQSAMGEGSFSKIANPLCKKGITDSTQYLKKILGYSTSFRRGLGGGSEWRINNLSISLYCAEPRMDPLVPKMKKNLSRLLDIEERKIGITATGGNQALSENGIKCRCGITILRYAR